MTDVPSYIDVLGAIARGQGRGALLLETWARSTTDQELGAVLTRLAARERDHAARFGSRLRALGHALPEHEDPRFAARLACARDAGSDRQRFETLIGFSAVGVDAPIRDGLERLLEDQRIDPETGALLGRFIAEERDSQRQLRTQYRRVLATRSAPRSQAGRPISVRGPVPAEPIRQTEVVRPRSSLRAERSPPVEHDVQARVRQSDQRNPGAADAAATDAAPTAPPATTPTGTITSSDAGAIERALAGNVVRARQTRKAPVPAASGGAEGSAKPDEAAGSSAAELAASPVAGDPATAAATTPPPAPREERGAEGAAADARLVRLRAFLDPVASG